MAKGFHPFQQPSDSAYSLSEENNNSSSRESDMHARRSALNLPLGQMAIPMYVAPSREEVAVGGHVLLHNFIHEEFEHEGLPDDVLEVENPSPGAFGDVGPQMFYPNMGDVASPTLASTPDGYKNAQLIYIGSNIRELANQFACSKERPLIRQQADQVDLGHINQESFFHLLNEIFKDGINKHCIVALFFFCSDVLIRCVRQELRELGTKLFLWSLQYLIEKVCNWVYDHGGWERVFSSLYTLAFKVSTIAALGIIISCGLIWMKKNW